MLAAKHLCKRTTVLRHNDTLVAAISTDAQEKPIDLHQSRPPKLFLKQTNLRPFFKMDRNQDIYFQHHTFWMKYGENEDWSNTWPALAPFNPYTVPLPLRMGINAKLCVKPDKFSSLELIKVQNFLHLTPPAIEKHCKVLKQFCTKFPEELDSDAACETEFPIAFRTTDYLGAANSPRVPKARFVELQFRLCSLGLDKRTRRKMIKLLGHRYNFETDVATIRTGRCPVRKQNREFLEYVLTALYFESWKTEEWEKPEYANDYDMYAWENSQSYENLRRLLEKRDGLPDDAVLSDVPVVRQYKNAVESLKSDIAEAKRLDSTTMRLKPMARQIRSSKLFAKSSPDRQAFIDDYKRSVLNLLKLNPESQSAEARPQASC